MFKKFPLAAGLVCLALSSFAQPGAPDATFGNNGTATFLAQPLLNKAYGIALQSDQKILLAGYALSGTANVFVLARLMPNGDYDFSFGADSHVETAIGSDAQCFALALQPDGKILLAGGAAVATNGSKDFALLRYQSNGLRDSSFGVNGIRTISFGTGDDVARAIALQADGKILLAGTATTGNGSLMALARFKPDGSPDASFSSDGKVTLGIGTFFTRAYALAVQSDGKIVLAGDAKFGMADDLALARFLPNGTPDPAFGTAGHVTIDLGSDADSGSALALQPDGKIIVAGITGANRDFALLRYLDDGTTDPDFGDQGVTTTDFAGSDDFANAVLLQPDGKIVAGGYAYNGALPDFALARYLPDGTPDADFGTAGRVTTDFGDDAYDYGFPMAMQSDGKLLLGGYSFSDGHTAFAAARYLSGLNVGVVDFSMPKVLLIAPNPVGERATFEFETGMAGCFTLTLTDAQGRTLQTFFLGKNFAAGRHAEELLLSANLPGGWYFLRLSDGGKDVVVKILKG